MKRELVIAGVVILVLGSLFFALSQVNRTRDKEVLTLAFEKSVYSNGDPTVIVAPLESYTKYKFNVTSSGSVNSIAGTSVPFVKLSNSEMGQINYDYLNEFSKGVIPDSGLWGYGDTYGEFTSGTAGSYNFELGSFMGNPDIVLSVFKVGTGTETYYPYDYMITIAIIFWLIGGAITIYGAFRKVPSQTLR